MYRKKISKYDKFIKNFRTINDNEVLENDQITEMINHIPRLIKIIS